MTLVVGAVEVYFVERVKQREVKVKSLEMVREPLQTVAKAGKEKEQMLCI